MLDLKWVREHPDLIKEAGRKKHMPCADNVDECLAVDRELRVVLPKVEGLRATQKQMSKGMGRALCKEGCEEGAWLAKQQGIKQEIKDLSQKERELEARRSELLLLLPNIPAAEVPEGKDDSENVEIRRYGEPRSFAFAARSHIEIGESLGILDFVRAAVIAGTRNYFLKGDGVLLEEAVLQLGMQHMLAKGFVPMGVPLLVRDFAMQGTAYFPGGEEQTYRCEKDELNLIGTSEVPLTSFPAGDVLDVADLPKRYVARSYCFRREAGTYGKDTKGLYRVHQFQKIEQVIIDVADPEVSLRHHEAITKNSEELLQALGLPYRVVNVCGGDLGQAQIQKFDIETWMPSRDSYGETHSASRFHDFQARRLNLRYRGPDGKPRFCHTLNNTVVATSRILIAILENNQEEDGSVRVPKVLQAFMGKESIA